MSRVKWHFLFLVFVAKLMAASLQVPDPHPTIQSAIDEAVSFDEVVVQPGTYYENINFAGKSITVRSVNPNDPNVVAATIINGLMPADPNTGSVVTFNSGEGSDSVLMGFTITGGTGSWIPVSWRFKGVRWNRCGGGVICYNMSAPTIANNVFVQNSAGQGGGIYIYGKAVNDSNPVNPSIHLNPVIQENIFVNNTALVNHGFAPPDETYAANDHGDGGAIVAFQGVDAVITNNLIQMNHADQYGGGIHCRQWSHGLIEDNTFTNNDSNLGGGIHITYNSAPTIRSNTVMLNSATNLGGGGIYVYYQSAPIIEMNLITQNTSTNGAGLGIFWDSNPIVRNNLIVKNIGRGITMTDSSPEISFNTIADNDDDGIYLKSTGNSPVINHNIIVSNGVGIDVSIGNSPQITYNDVWGNMDGQYLPVGTDQTELHGNLSADPVFADPNNNNYRLQYDSVCVDAGDPNFTNPLGLTDYQGTARIIASSPDMGALESWPVWNMTSASQYLYIQDAVDDANDADMLILRPGTYQGAGNRDINFNGKSIILQSIDPQDEEIVQSTIIDCQGSEAEPHRAFWFRRQEDPNAIVQGITMTGGGGMYDGGAIKCANNSNPTIRNCLFMNNSARGRAGAIYVDRSSPVIANCTFIGNIATDGYGGAIACFYDSFPLIKNCLITGNTAAGADHHGGGICFWNGSDGLVLNCLVTANSADHRGGGLYAYWSDPTYINCTVIGNYALEGGGICSFRESNPLVINCIVRDNRSPDGDQLALINTSRVWAGTQIPTSMTVSYSNIQGGSAEATVDPLCTLTWGDGNIDGLAGFLDPGVWIDPNTPLVPEDDYFVAGNYHIAPASPCYQAGDSNSLPAESITDLDGEPRVLDNRVEMGSDEVLTHPMDFDVSGRVDRWDLSLCVEQWLTSNVGMDFNTDGIVDWVDYASFALAWNWTAQWETD
jgi:hypothetical protein